MNDLVSVIIPAYNVGDYIEDCLESVCNQTYRDLEIIVINDGSTDNTYSKCEEIAKNDKRIILINQNNQGVVTARNSGINRATGKYLAFVDGDDWIEEGMIEYMINNIGDSDMVSIGVYHEKDANLVVERFDKYQEGLYSGNEEINIILSKMIYDVETELLHPMTSWIYNKLYKLDIAREIHSGLDSNIKFAEDSAFLYMYLLKCNSVVIKHRCLYHYRYREGSAIHKANHYVLEDISRFYNLLRPLFEKTDSALELMYQLQKWVSSRVCLSVNELMGLDDRVKIPRHIFVSNEFNGKKLALYGAGKVGIDYYSQFVRMGIEIVCWADKNYKRFENMEYVIISPEEIKNYDYDLLIICIENEEIKNEIKKQLMDMGIDSNKIYWSRPFLAF